MLVNQVGLASYWRPADQGWVSDGTVILRRDHMGDTFG